jgi:hypothetical protein
VRLVKHLDDDPVRVGAVKRRAPVTVGLERLDDLDSIGAEFLFEVPDARGALDDKTQMIERATARSIRRRRCFMERQIVAAGRKIDVLQIGLPDDLHPEALPIKLLGAADVPHFEGDVAQSPESFDGGHSSFISQANALA